MNNETKAGEESRNIFLESEFAQVTDLLEQVPFGDVVLNEFQKAVDHDTVKITDDNRGFYALANHPDSDHYIYISKENETDTVLLVIKDRGLVDECGIDHEGLSEFILEAGEIREIPPVSRKSYKYGIRLNTQPYFNFWLNEGHYQWMIGLIFNITQASKESYSSVEQPSYRPDGPKPPVQRI